MKEQLINFETAKLAKEKGFNEPTINYWERGIDGNGWALFTSGSLLTNIEDLTSTYFNKKEICGEFSAPTQSLLQRWLREKHNLHIVIQTGLGEEPWWSGQVIEISTNDIVNDISNSWKSYEAALEYILWLTLKENI